jgi:hypothetical protein
MTKQPEAREPDQPLALSSSAVLGPNVEMPEPIGAVMPEDGRAYVDCYSATQMHDYAGACVLAATTECSQHWQANQITGFACVMRDEGGREFLAVQTFGDSRGKAKRAARAMNSRRIDARKPALEMLRVCEVGVRVLQGQPPVDNSFVADGCELFGA